MWFINQIEEVKNSKTAKAWQVAIRELRGILVYYVRTSRRSSLAIPIVSLHGFMTRLNRTVETGNVQQMSTTTLQAIPSASGFKQFLRLSPVVTKGLRHFRQSSGLY